MTSNAVIGCAIDVPEQDLIERLAGRRSCKKCGTGFHIKLHPPKTPGHCDKCNGELYQRNDDHEDIITDRLVVYRSQTEPLLVYYAHNKLLCHVSGSGDMDTITERLINAIKP